MESPNKEGCGREGPIRCIFLAEFHPIAGPKIVCQFPEDYISEQVFDSISAYIIPKAHISKCTMTVDALSHKIIGYPIRIESSRYERNVYLFNLCFVCDSSSRTVQYEPVVKKIGDHLTTLEEETGFVSKGSSRLPTLLAHLLHDLNTHRQATIVEGDTVMHLKVVEVRVDPVSVEDYDVPVLISSVGFPRPGCPQHSTPPDSIANRSQENLDVEDDKFLDIAMDNDWDLTTKQLLPYLNGYNHIAKIAADSDVEKTLVKSCIQNLIYYGVVTLVPILKFSNMYRATPNLKRIFNDNELQRACLKFVNKEVKGDKASIANLIEVLCGLRQGTTLRQVCERFTSAHGYLFDVRKLIIFAQLHGLIRCVKRYPIYLRNNVRPSTFNNETESKRSIYKLFTGSRCDDEICCTAKIDLNALDKIIDEDPNVIVIWR